MEGIPSSREKKQRPEHWAHQWRRQINQLQMLNGILVEKLKGYGDESIIDISSSSATAGYGDKDVSRRASGGGGGGGDSGDEPPEDNNPSDDDDGGDDDIYGSECEDDWMEVFISNGTSTLVSEVKGSWLFKSIFYSVASKWKIGNTRVMRFVNGKGDTMIPSITIAQNEVKHQASLTLLFDGVGGASQKRRAISIADMAVREADLDGVKAVFNIRAFNSRGWLQSLPADKV